MKTTKAIHDLNGYELANLADLGDTVELTAGDAGFEMLDTVRTCIADAIENGEFADRDADEIIHEIADSSVPVYYADIFEALVELRAWGEDVEDITPTDLSQGAMVCLYLVGERLARSLVEAYAPESVEA